MDCSFEMFRARRHEIAWITHTRLDLCAARVRMSRTTEHTFSKEAVKLLDETVQKAKYGRVKGLRHHDLNIDSLKMVAYADSSFANYDELATQFCYAVLLTNDIHRVN